MIGHAWFARLYERHPLGYLVLVYAVAFGQMMLYAAPVSLVAADRVYAAGATTTWLTVLVADLGLLLTIAIAFIVWRSQLSALVRWCRGERSVGLAEQVIEIARGHGSRRFATVAVPVGVVLVIVPTDLLLLARVDRLTVKDLLFISAGGAGAAFYSIVLGWLVGELGLRRFAGDAARYLPAGASQRVSVSVGLATKLALGTIAATLISAETVAMFRLRSGAGVGALASALGVAFAATVVALATVVLILALIVLVPIRNLIRGTRAGTVTDAVLVPVVSDDELGELTASFNAMVSDLRAARERIVAAADDARRRVERDLHDGAQQHLVLLRLKLGLLAKKLAGEPAAAAAVADMTAELDRALGELRNLARGIYPPQLEDGGLAEALREAACIAATAVRLEPDGVGRYARELEAAVYFCCVEALQNVAKHGGDGAQAVVRLTDRDGWLEFVVSDDGRGFDPATASHPSGGVQNIIDRVGALGGCVAVRSAPGKGTEISAAIPVVRT
jgi:signal transduction histidine kinase